MLLYEERKKKLALIISVLAEVKDFTSRVLIYETVIVAWVNFSMKTTL